MKRFLILILLLASITPTNIVVAKSNKLEVNDWSNLPILHEGRVKPIDSFARIMMKTFANAESVGDLNASEWLALSVFDPARGVEFPIFKIRDFERYELSQQKNDLYSYTDLSGVIQSQQKNISTLLKQEQKKWSSNQDALMQLYEYYILYSQILRALTIIIPLDSDDGEKNFLDYKKSQRNLDEKIKNIIKRKGTDLEKYTDEEKRISFLSYQLKILEDSAENNVLFRIIPENWEIDNTNWHAPWNIINKGKGSPKSAEYIGIWKNMSVAYYNQDNKKWQKNINEASNFFASHKLYVEKIYNVLNLLQVVILLYGLSLLLMVISNFINNKLSKNIERISFTFLTFGITAHSAHIFLRIYILERPPVGTLYESILFVSLICVAGFVYMAWSQKTNIWILLGSLSGILLLTTAQGFVSEDTMSTLVAVLNTNFWLGTHVICITIGYGTCFIASLMAHYILVIKWIDPNNAQLFKQNFKNLKILIILCLLLTTIGTILGGIWADQSWGRFWGWDPKENGALLIVLWLAWLLHGCISKHINNIGFVIGSALLSIIVVLAWFGVNLLNIGLHSYGFITGVALSIGIFCAFEIILVTALWKLGKSTGVQHEK